MRESIKKLIMECDFISVDTSALMEVDTFKKFINESKEALQKAGRKIFVYREVIKELQILYQIAEGEKSTRAEEALGMLYDFYEIFRCEEEPDEVDWNIVRCTADQRILGAVTWYKPYHSQLFISNDKKLLKGILQVDKQEAVRGRAVYAASLTCDGDLEQYEESEEYIEEHIKAEDAQKETYSHVHRKGLLWGSVLGMIIRGNLPPEEPVSGCA